MRVSTIIILIFTVSLTIHSLPKTGQLFIPTLSLKNYSDNRLILHEAYGLRANYDSSSHFGFEYGNIYKLTEANKDEYFGTLWLFADFNLYKRIVFFNLELGGVYGKKIDGKQTQYSISIFLAAGVDFKVFQKNRHILYLSSGLMLIVKMGGGGYGSGIFVTANPKYVFQISKYFGLSASVKYMTPIFDFRGLILPSVGFKFFL